MSIKEFFFIIIITFSEPFLNADFFYRFQVKYYCNFIHPFFFVLFHNNLSPHLNVRSIFFCDVLFIQKENVLDQLSFSNPP